MADLISLCKVHYWLRCVSAIQVSADCSPLSLCPLYYPPVSFLAHTASTFQFPPTSATEKSSIFKVLALLKNSIRDARTPQPRGIFFNTMRYRSSVTVQSSRYFHSSVSYIKVQIMLK